METLDSIFERHGGSDAAIAWLENEEDSVGRTAIAPTAPSRLTYSTSQEALERHRGWLTTLVKEAPSTVVAYLSSNGADYFLSVLACSGAAVPAVPALLNPRWSAAEAASVLQAPSPSDATILLYSTELTDLAQEVQARLHHRTKCLPIPNFATSATRSQPSMRGPCRSSLKASDAVVERGFPEDDAVVVFTSGTSGAPRGVRLSHRALLVQARAKGRPPCAYDRDTRLLASTVPFCHVGGLSSVLAVWRAGGTVLLLPPPPPRPGAGFSPRQVLRALSSERRGAVPNTLAVVPAMLHSLEKERDAQRSAAVFPHVRLVLIGGQSASRRNLRFLAGVCPHARIVQTFACTEAASSLTFLLLNEKETPPGVPVSRNVAGDCVGYPAPQVRITITQAGQPVSEPFQIGNIAFRGPCLMNGYWSRRHESPTSRKNPLCFVTNDLGFWDEQGRLYFAGRSTDSIRTAGETVFAAQVEQVLMEHPSVEECAVFGLKDERFGEAVCCAIVCRSQCPSLGDLRIWCDRRGLTGYKRPTQLFTLQELPRNSSGKVLKHRLVETFGRAHAVHSRL